MSSLSQVQEFWAVLVVFLIPFGGGIPAGVLLAQKYSFSWPLTALLYFVSDIILACIFEPLMKFVVWMGRNSEPFMKAIAAIRESTLQTINRFTVRKGSIALVLISFGVDPMTGRAATALAGHGFISGWAHAIVGDMFYFAVIMASTLWLSHILGDGTVATVIIVLIMVFAPNFFRWAKARLTKKIA